MTKFWRESRTLTYLALLVAADVLPPFGRQVVVFEEPVNRSETVVQLPAVCVEGRGIERGRVTIC